MRRITLPIGLLCVCVHTWYVLYCLCSPSRWRRTTGEFTTTTVAAPILISRVVYNSGWFVVASSLIIIIIRVCGGIVRPADQSLAAAMYPRQFRRRHVSSTVLDAPPSSPPFSPPTASVGVFIYVTTPLRRRCGFLLARGRSCRRPRRRSSSSSATTVVCLSLKNNVGHWGE